MVRPTRAIAVVCLLTPVLGALADDGRPRPNVVFLLADDLGYGDVKCFGGERCRVATPAFDRLAREGVRFTDAHANASVCVPTRMAIMSGRYPWRFGPPAPGGPWGFLGLRFPPGQHTLGTMMRQAGYRTGYVGKWHLGTRMATTDGKPQGIGNVDFGKPLRVGPPEHGFDDSFILPGSLDMYPYAFVRDNRWVGEVTAEKGWSAFNRVGPAAEDFEDTKVLDTLATQAERFIADRAAEARGGRPFFLFVALTSPHTPVSPSESFRGRSELGLYGDFVMETDDCLRRVLEALDDAGLTDNTLVIATSDHGPASYAGPELKATPGQIHELERQGHYPSGPFRGYKFSVYEGGLRVPLVARWPNVAPAGQQCDRLIALHDLMATLAELSAVELQPHQGVDSISFAPLLRDPQSAAPRRSLVLEATRAMAIREGQWKLALCPGSGCPGVYGNEPPGEAAWRAARARFGRPPKSPDELLQAPFVQLFDLRADPGERTNLAQHHGDRVRQMAGLLQSVIDEGRSTPGPRQANDRGDVKLFPAVPPLVWK